MTATATLPSSPPVVATGPARRRLPWVVLAPSLFAAANALAFYLIRPGVNDLWAARARSSAVTHGVGLSYWFTWYGGGATPGNYSVLTPYVTAGIGTELVCALSAVAVTALATVAVRGTRHPLVASWLAAAAAVVNLWSGRVPFLLGAAVGVGAVIAVRRGQRLATATLTLLSVLVSPVSGAFVALGLSGTFLTTRTKSYRPIIGVAVVTAGVALAVVGFVFGGPGQEDFSALVLLEGVFGLCCLRVARPPDHLRTTLGVTALATVLVWAIPNGLGANVVRFISFALPVAVAATSERSRRLFVPLLSLVLALGAIATVLDLLNAVSPVASVGYYKPLADELDKLPDNPNYRVEVVTHDDHAGYDALLEHAWLARGWESQPDNQFNQVLEQDPLSPVAYKVWLDNNAVGYVALPGTSIGNSSEYTLVSKHRAPYLHRIWSNRNWQLFRVEDATPIVGRPGAVVRRAQSSVTLRIPCACTMNVRVRWSKFLEAALQVPGPTANTTIDAQPLVQAVVADDGTGWTTVTTVTPGTYTLRGSLSGGLLH